MVTVSTFIYFSLAAQATFCKMLPSIVIVSEPNLRNSVDLLLVITYLFRMNFDGNLDKHILFSLN